MELILSRENARIKDYCKLTSGKQARKKAGRFTLEGTRLCKEALLSDVEVEYAFVTSSWCNAQSELLVQLEHREVPVYQISGQLEQKLSETVGPQGVYFVCRTLSPLTPEKLAEYKKILCLYDIQDPGNLGTMIRSADAFGFEAVVFSSGCCDLFSPKVLRSTMGSVFHLPYYIAEDMPGFEAAMTERGLVSAAAVVEGADLKAGCCNLPEIHLLYIGNEGNGLPKDFSRLCRYRITLPMKGKAESLNAAMAAGILMWELTK